MTQIETTPAPSDAAARDPRQAAAEEAVARLYRDELGRAPDAAGLARYSAEILAGRATPEAVRAAMRGSPEYARRRHGGGGASKASADHLVRLEARGCVWLLPAGTPMAQRLREPGGYEPWALPLFVESCRPGMTVLDIGAHWGAYALPAARAVGPAGRVVAFEASPANARILLRNARASGLANLELLPFGIGAAVGTALVPAGSRTGNNILRPIAAAGGDDDPLAGADIVPVMPLDLLARHLGPVHLVKMDIEGMETLAVRGGRALFAGQRPMVFLEYSPEFQRKGSGDAGGELLGAFLGLGYAVEVLHRGRPREMVAEATSAGTIGRIDRLWRQHVEEDRGSHLDLRLLPPGGT